jgi:hypothetical protein
MELGFVSLNIVLAAIMLVYVKRENRIRRNGGRDSRLNEGGEEGQEAQRLGSAHPAWLFCE